MTPNRSSSLLRHQWTSYPRAHQSRRNLLVHIVAVPVFVIANVLLVVSIVKGAWVVALLCAAMLAASLVAQGRGHRSEPIPAEPFTGPINIVVRLIAEQWLTFPRFVGSGRWWRTVRHTTVR